MILDTFDAKLDRYVGVNERLARAFAWATTADLKALPDGIVEIDGKRIYAIVATYDTQPKEQRTFEAHRNYLDVQIMAAGEELQLWTPLANLDDVAAPYDAAKDCVRFKDPAGDVASFVLKPGYFSIFLPEDGHKPSCAVDAPKKVKKATMKVAL